MTVVLAALCAAIGAGLVVRAKAARITPVRPRRDRPPPARVSPASCEDLVVSDIPLAAELVVVALQAGVPLATAIEVAGRAVGGRMGQHLCEVYRSHSVGADLQTATLHLRTCPATARVGRALARAGASGASPLPVLSAAAEAERSSRRSARVTRARSVGSLAALPVGLLFLPAFVLVAVVPVVVGSLGDVLGSP